MWGIILIEQLEPLGNSDLATHRLLRVMISETCNTSTFSLQKSKIKLLSFWVSVNISHCYPVLLEHISQNSSNTSKVTCIQVLLNLFKCILKRLPEWGRTV